MQAFRFMFFLPVAFILSCDQGVCAASHPGRDDCAESVGGLGQPICICPTADEGRPCTDAASCEGTCLVEPSTPLPCEAAVSGACSATQTVFGCFCELRAGEADYLCVD